MSGDPKFFSGRGTIKSTISFYVSTSSGTGHTVIRPLDIVLS